MDKLPLVEILGGQSFKYLKVTLDKDQAIVTESGAMASMSTKIELRTKLNAGLFKGLLRKFLGGESLIINTFSNPSNSPQTIYLTTPTPGDIREYNLDEGQLTTEGGSYLCSTPGVKMSLVFAGFRSLIAREGLFKLLISGTGKVWLAGYGSFFEKEINGEYLVDSGHLVAHPNGIKSKLQLVGGGLIGAFLSGEGFVMRLEGKGTVILQTRSIRGLASWINPKL